MLYRRYNPPPPLAAFVGCLWYSEGFEGSHCFERLLPNGESGIVFDLRQQLTRNPIRIWDAYDAGKLETFAPAIFCGARADCFVIDTCQQDRVLGVQFRPGGAFPFLDMPASEVANATYSLDDIWPGEAAPLRDALMHASSIESMFSVVERALLARLERASPLHPAVAYATRCLARPGANLPIGDLADRVGLSSRRFIELFRQQTGLAPKSFQRVRRFQHVLRTLHGKTQGNWSAIAQHCGFYDQAHFIHDFRLFSGMTPGEYVAAATPHLNHVPLA